MTLEAIYDETCLECDSYHIKMTKLNEGHAEYLCLDCNFFWNDETEY